MGLNRHIVNMIFLEHKIIKMTINRQKDDKSSNLAATIMVHIHTYTYLIGH